jgi:hypothetical protein
VKNKAAILAAITFLIFLTGSASAVENYASDFDSETIGSYPGPWQQWQETNCGEPDCKNGHAKVNDNFAASGTKSLECLEKTAGKRRCYIKATIEPRSKLTMNYSLSVKAGSNHASIQLFENSSGSYQKIKDIARLEGSSSDKTEEGAIVKYDLGKYAGDSLFIGVEVSGEGAGGGRSYAAIDNFNLSDGGEAAAPTDLEKDVKDEDITDRLVLGRKVNTSYQYEVESTYFPVDTALVMDTSGSMCSGDFNFFPGGGYVRDCGPDDKLPNAKEAAKEYIDNTNTSKGDKNSIVGFNDLAEVHKNLTNSKAEVKSAIDGLKSGNGTNTEDGLSKGIEVLNNGSNPVQAMIVLADGKRSSGTPQVGPTADRARDEGIEVHGIMYGDDADTTEFEEITGAEYCTNSSLNADGDIIENVDGDNCWNASKANIGDVYESIREELEKEREANISMVLPDYAMVDMGETDSFDDIGVGGGFKRFKRNYIDLSEGNKTESIIWYPLENGTDKLVSPGDTISKYSRIRFRRGTDITYFNYSTPITRDIGYIDFDILDNYTVVRNKSKTKFKFSVRNKGNALSAERKVKLASGPGVDVEFDIGRLGPSSVHNFNQTFDNSYLIVDNLRNLTIEADPDGFWNGRSKGRGETLEPNETNNKANLGYPPELAEAKPGELKWNETFNVNLTLRHPYPSSVTGEYNYSNKTKTKTAIDLQKSSNSTHVNLWTEDHNASMPESYYNFTFIAKDPNGAILRHEKSYFVENPKPIVKVRNPPNDGLVLDENFPVQLKAYVEDRNDKEVNVSFHNADTGNLIGSQDYVDSENGTEVKMNWDDSGTIYHNWIVNVTDNYGSYQSEFSFRSETGRTYRTDLNVELNYSSIVMNEGSVKYAEVIVKNNALTKKNLNLSLEGIESEFLNGKDYKYLPDFGQRDSEKFLVRLTPDKEGSTKLDVVAYNRDIGLNTTRSIPVSVLSSTAERSEVPGIGLTQLMFIFAVSTVLYFVRL